MKVEQDPNLSLAATQVVASYQQRRERGRAARRLAPRGSHAVWVPAPDRPDPVDLLETQARDRIQELMPIRYTRMMASPFAFMRGAAIIMAQDLARTPKTSIQAQLCGDAHLLNFGAYASPERALLFDLNDFDETLPGPWEWDVKRLAASFMVAGRDNGFDAAACRDVARASVPPTGSGWPSSRRWENSRSGTRALARRISAVCSPTPRTGKRPRKN
jgi:uncharacterized protein (DUF2252 family)